MSKPTSFPQGTIRLCTIYELDIFVCGLPLNLTFTFLGVRFGELIEILALGEVAHASVL
jgi:hypothetical protein